jgi:predicted protein tyrosine phosphatase
MKFTPLPRIIIESELFTNKHILISITGTDEKEVKLPINENRMATLHLKFDDISSPKAGLVLFTETQAGKILDVVDIWENDIDEVIVHCNAGISRSPAVAAALSKIWNEDDDMYFRKYIPNVFVYNKILNTILKRHIEWYSEEQEE